MPKNQVPWWKSSLLAASFGNWGLVVNSAVQEALPKMEAAHVNFSHIFSYIDPSSWWSIISSMAITIWCVWFNQSSVTPPKMPGKTITNVISFLGF